MESEPFVADREMRIKRSVVALVFALASVVGFFLIFQNFIQPSPVGEKAANKLGLTILAVLFGASTLGGSFSLWWYGQHRPPTVFFLSLQTVIFLYGRRIASQYLFQDDFHHVLPVLRLGFAGLWTPFVDHITPLWRIWHWIPIRIFGGYFATFAFPVMGALNLAVLGTTLFHCLKKRRVAFPLLWSLLALTYPGFQSVMYWMSTNAMVLSSSLGLLAVDRFFDSAEKEGPKRSLTVLFLLVGSFYFWSTGLAFAVFLVGVSLLESVGARIRSSRLEDRPLPWLRLSQLAAPAAAVALFVLTRMIVFAAIPDEYLRANLWLLGAREHGSIFHPLRPILWPLASYWEGTLVLGVFGGEPLLRLRQYMGDARFLGMSSGVGALLFAAACAISAVARGRLLNLYRALLFPICLFAIIFLGRGVTLVGEDFLAYGLFNDWYRITAVIGLVYFLACCTEQKQEKSGVWRASLLGTLVLFGYTSLERSKSPHIIEGYARQSISDYPRLSCLRRLPWTAADFAYASKYLFLPLAGSNPGNFWTGYQPSYFDLFFRGSPVQLIPAAQRLDQARVAWLSSQLEAACRPETLSWRDSYAWLADTYQVRPEGELVLPIPSLAEGSFRVEGAPGQACGFGEWQLLGLTLTAREDFNGQPWVELEGKRYPLGSLRDGVHDVRLPGGESLETSLELRALKPETRCSDRLQLKFSHPQLALKKAKLIRGSLFLDQPLPQMPTGKQAPADRVGVGQAPSPGRQVAGRTLGSGS